MKLSEKILLLFCRNATSGDYPDAEENDSGSDPLGIFVKHFGNNVINELRGKDILDVGSGLGYQSIAFAKNGANRVVGTEISEKFIKFSEELAIKERVSDKARFVKTSLPDKRLGLFDAIVSINSFEHYAEPEEMLNSWKSLLKPDGKIYIHVGALWFSPYGSHMHFFTKVPWVNLLFSETTIMKVRSRYRMDGAMKFSDVEGGLNKLTLRKFMKIMNSSGLRIAALNLIPSRKMKPFTYIPLLRELFTRAVSCVLQA